MTDRFILMMIPINDPYKKGCIYTFNENLISGNNAKKLFINGGGIKEACLATKETISAEWGMQAPGVVTYTIIDGGGIPLFRDRDGEGSLDKGVDELAAFKVDQLCIMCLYKDNSVAVSDPVTVNWDLTQIPDFYDDED